MAAISYQEFIRQLIAGKFAPVPVIAVAGDEAFMRRDAMAGLRHMLEQQGFGWERLDHDELTGLDLVGRLRSSSLFGDKSALVLKSARRAGKQEAILRFKDDLLQYLDRPSDGNLLIFDGEAWNGSLAVPKKIKKDYLVVECDSFKPWDTRGIIEFVESIALRHGLKPARGVAELLFESCGGDFGMCDTELAKLALVVEGELLPWHLEQNLRDRGAEHAFALCDALLAGNQRQVADLGRNLFTSEDPGVAMQFLGLLESQLRKLCRYSWLRSSGGLPDTEALSKAGYNPRAPQVAVARSVAPRLDSTKVKQIFAELLRADRELKGGGSLPPGTVMLSTVNRLGALLAKR